MIIAFSGKKFAGKDTAAEGLIKTYKFKRIGLADKLKDICSTIFEIPRQDMDTPSKKEIPFDKSIVITENHIQSLITTFVEDGLVFDYQQAYTYISANFRNKTIISIRDLLQVVGTDICRRYIKDSIWLDYVDKIVQNIESDVVITDARFKNEREYLKSLGAVLILVKREGTPSSSHISENQLGSEEDYDVIVDNNDTIMALQSSIALWYSLSENAIKGNIKRRY